VMAGEGELVIVRGAARNGTEQAHGQEDCVDCEGSFWTGVLNLDVDADVRAG